MYVPKYTSECSENELALASYERWDMQPHADTGPHDIPWPRAWYDDDQFFACLKAVLYPALKARDEFCSTAEELTRTGEFASAKGNLKKDFSKETHDGLVERIKRLGNVMESKVDEYKEGKAAVPAGDACLLHQSHPAYSTRASCMVWMGVRTCYGQCAGHVWRIA